MTDDQKLTRLKALLNINDIESDPLLTEYISMAGEEILNWLYSNYQGVPEDVTEVPKKYEQIQIEACIAGFNIRGAEGQIMHIENGVHITFKYESMVSYIHSNVYPYIGIGALE